MINYDQKYVLKKPEWEDVSKEQRRPTFQSDTAIGRMTTCRGCDRIWYWWIDNGNWGSGCADTKEAAIQAAEEAYAEQALRGFDVVVDASIKEALKLIDGWRNRLAFSRHAGRA